MATCKPCVMVATTLLSLIGCACAGGHPANPVLTIDYAYAGLAVFAVIAIGMHLVWMYQAWSLKKATAVTMTERLKTADSREIAAAEKRMHDAARAGDTRIIDRALELGADINSKDPTGKTALYIAAQQGQLECLKLLVSQGASVNKTNSSGVSPLLAAVISSSFNSACKDCAIILINADANVELNDSAGDTPLIAAVRDNVADVVEALIAMGADSFHENKRGETAESIAGDGPMARLLNEEGQPPIEPSIATPQNNDTVVRSRPRKRATKAET